MLVNHNQFQGAPIALEQAYCLGVTINLARIGFELPFASICDEQFYLDPIVMDMVQADFEDFLTTIMLSTPREAFTMRTEYLIKKYKELNEQSRRDELTKILQGAYLQEFELMLRQILTEGRHESSSQH